MNQGEIFLHQSGNFVRGVCLASLVAIGRKKNFDLPMDGDAVGISSWRCF